MFHCLASPPQSLEQAISHLSVLRSPYPVCMAALPLPPPYRPPVSGLISSLLFIIGTTQCWETKAMTSRYCLLHHCIIGHLVLSYHPSIAYHSGHLLPPMEAFVSFCLSIRYRSIVKPAVSHLETSNPHLLLENRLLNISMTLSLSLSTYSHLSAPAVLF